MLHTPLALVGGIALIAMQLLLLYIVTSVMSRSLDEVLPTTNIAYTPKAPLSCSSAVRDGIYRTPVSYLLLLPLPMKILWFTCYSSSLPLER